MDHVDLHHFNLQILCHICQKKEMEIGYNGSYLYLFKHLYFLTFLIMVSPLIISLHLTPKLILQISIYHCI